MTPSSWQRKRVGELFEVQLGKMLSPRAKTGASPKPYLRNANVQWGHIDLSDLAAMDFGDAERAKFALRSGDLLVCEGGEIGRSAIWKGQLSECYYQKALHRLRPLNDGALVEFLLHFLTQKYRAEGGFKGEKSQTTIAHLPKEQLEKVEVLLPPLHEQRKIAAILSSVDDTIEKTEAVINQLQVVKKSMMEELLTRGIPGRHTQFLSSLAGRFPSTWNVLPLESVAVVQTGIAKGKSVAENADAVVVPYLRVANVQDGYVDLQEMKTLLVEKAALSRYSLRSGDVLFTEGGDADKLGRGCVWRGQMQPCLHQNHVFAVRVNPSRLLPEFLAVWAGSKGGRAYFLGCAKQTTNLASINSTQLKALPVPLPAVQEQAEIVEPLEAIQRRVDTEQTVLSQVRALKAALMEALLSGRTRVQPQGEAA